MQNNWLTLLDQPSAHNPSPFWAQASAFLFSVTFPTFSVFVCLFIYFFAKFRLFQNLTKVVIFPEWKRSAQNPGFPNPVETLSVVLSREPPLWMNHGRESTSVVWHGRLAGMGSTPQGVKGGGGSCSLNFVPQTKWWGGYPTHTTSCVVFFLILIYQGWELHSTIFPDQSKQTGFGPKRPRYFTTMGGTSQRGRVTSVWDGGV